MNTLASTSQDPKMTPRRVKRRSVSRESGRRSRSSQRSRPTASSSSGMVNEAYSSGTMASQNGTLTSMSSQHRGRESLRKKRYVNPVNRLMDESSTSNDSMPALPAYFPSSHPNGGYPAPPPPVHRDRLPYMGRPPPTSRPPAVLPPPAPPGNNAGHSNPLYQSSRPSSVYSISANVEMDYRPPSGQSSYSNFHPQRSALPSNGHNNLHGHSPTPSTATTATHHTFGVPDRDSRAGSAAGGQVANGYSRSSRYSNYSNGHGHGIRIKNMTPLFIT